MNVNGYLFMMTLYLVMGMSIINVHGRIQQLEQQLSALEAVQQDHAAGARYDELQVQSIYIFRDSEKPWMDISCPHGTQITTQATTDGKQLLKLCREAEGK